MGNEEKMLRTTTVEPRFLKWGSVKDSQGERDMATTC